MNNINNSKNNILNIFKEQHVFLILCAFLHSVQPIKGIPFLPSQWVVIIWFLYQFISIKVKAEKVIRYLVVPLILTTLIFYRRKIDYEMLKMIFGIIIYSVTFYKYIYINRNNLESVLRIYMKIAYIFSIICIFQEIGYLLEINVFYDYWYLNIYNIVSTSGQLLRVTSLTKEPAHFAVFLLPAMFIILSTINRNILNLKLTNRIIITVSFILTFSLVGYISVSIILIYLVFTNKLKYRVIFAGTITVLIISFSYIEALNNRIFYFSKNTYIVNSNTYSQHAIMSNAYVAYRSFVSNPLGTGLQTHLSNYRRYISDYNVFQQYVEINSEDAASLYLRLISEFGLLGIIYYGLFLYKNKIRVNKNIDKIPIFSNMISFSYLLLYPLRTGSYLNFLFWLFVSIYIVTKHQYFTRIA